MPSSVPVPRTQVSAAAADTLPSLVNNYFVITPGKRAARRCADTVGSQGMSPGALPHAVAINRLEDARVVAVHLLREARVPICVGPHRPSGPIRVGRSPQVVQVSRRRGSLWPSRVRATCKQPSSACDVFDWNFKGPRSWHLPGP